MMYSWCARGPSWSHASWAPLGCTRVENLLGRRRFGSPTVICVWISSILGFMCIVAANALGSGGRRGSSGESGGGGDGTIKGDVLGVMLCSGVCMCAMCVVCGSTGMFPEFYGC